MAHRVRGLRAGHHRVDDQHPGGVRGPAGAAGRRRLAPHAPARQALLEPAAADGGAARRDAGHRGAGQQRPAGRRALHPLHVRRQLRHRQRQRTQVAQRRRHQQLRPAHRGGPRLQQRHVRRPRPTTTPRTTWPRTTCTCCCCCRRACRPWWPCSASSASPPAMPYAWSTTRGAARCTRWPSRCWRRSRRPTPSRSSADAVPALLLVGRGPHRGVVGHLPRGRPPSSTATSRSSAPRQT